MSYDKPNRIKYSFGTFDFGASADEEFIIKGPKGKAGRLWDYGVEAVTEVFAGVTTRPQMAVGITGNRDAFGEEFDFGTLAVNKAMSVRTTYDESSDKAAFDALMVARDIPANTEVFVTCIGATGGSETGMGVPFVIIDWAD